MKITITKNKNNDTLAEGSVYLEDIDLSLKIDESVNELIIDERASRDLNCLFFLSQYESFLAAITKYILEGGNFPIRKDRKSITKSDMLNLFSAEGKESVFDRLVKMRVKNAVYINFLKLYSPKANLISKTSISGETISMISKLHLFTNKNLLIKELSIYDEGFKRLIEEYKINEFHKVYFAFIKNKKVETEKYKKLDMFENKHIDKLIKKLGYI